MASIDLKKPELILSQVSYFKKKTVNTNSQVFPGLSDNIMLMFMY